MIKIYTHNDLDGVGCSVLANLAFDNVKLEVEYVNYDKINCKIENLLDEEINKYENIFITDVSVNEEVAEKINNYNKKQKLNKIILIDHHKTAMWLNKYDWCKVIVERDGKLESATNLFLETLVEYTKMTITDNIKMFVDLVSNYDTWRWVNLSTFGIKSKELNCLMHLIRQKEFTKTMVGLINTTGVYYLPPKLKKMVVDEFEKINKEVEKAKEGVVKTKLLDKFDIALVNYDGCYISELGNQLAKENLDTDFSVIINKKNKIVSFRSIKDNIHLGLEVAKVFNGGGHQKAAGCSLKDFEKKYYLIKQKETK